MKRYLIITSKAVHVLEKRYEESGRKGGSCEKLMKFDKQFIRTIKNLVYT